MSFLVVVLSPDSFLPESFFVVFVCYCQPHYLSSSFLSHYCCVFFLHVVANIIVLVPIAGIFFGIVILRIAGVFSCRGFIAETLFPRVFFCGGCMLLPALFFVVICDIAELPVSFLIVVLLPDSSSVVLPDVFFRGRRLTVSVGFFVAPVPALCGCHGTFWSRFRRQWYCQMRFSWSSSYCQRWVFCCTVPALCGCHGTFWSKFRRQWYCQPSRWWCPWHYCCHCDIADCRCLFSSWFYCQTLFSRVFFVVVVCYCQPYFLSSSFCRIIVASFFFHVVDNIVVLVSAECRHFLGHCDIADCRCLFSSWFYCQTLLLSC